MSIPDALLLDRERLSCRECKSNEKVQFLAHLNFWSCFGCHRILAEVPTSERREKNIRRALVMLLDV